MAFHYSDVIMSTVASQITGYCEGNPPVTVTGGLPSHWQTASNAENISIWWRHNGTINHSRLFLLNCARGTVVYFPRNNLKYLYHISVGKWNKIHIRNKKNTNMLQNNAARQELIHIAENRDPIISNYIHCKVWDEITDPVLNCNCWSLGMDDYFVPHFTWHVMAYLCWDWS